VQTLYRGPGERYFAMEKVKSSVGLERSDTAIVSKHAAEAYAAMQGCKEPNPLWQAMSDP
jgi:hypothetical protein